MLGGVTPSRAQTGTSIGPYVVEGPLGEGGFGEVVRARHRNLEREVALKLLKPNAGSTRFLREAQLLAQLEHPNIVRVYDFGEAARQLFMALELIRGETLLTRASPQDAWRAPTFRPVSASSRTRHPDFGCASTAATPRSRTEASAPATEAPSPARSAG